MFAQAASAADITRRSVAPGVEFVQESIPAPSGPLLINVLRVDLRNPAVKLRAELAGGTIIEDGVSKGREPLGRMASRLKAVAAVNADYFPFTGDPLGIAVRDGELLSEGLPHRATLGITSDGKMTFDTLACLGSIYAPDGTAWTIDGINRGLNPDELILLTPAYGEKTRTNGNGLVVPLVESDIPVRIGKDHSAKLGEFANGVSVPTIPPGGALVASGKSAEWLRVHLKSGDAIRLRFDMYANALAPGPPRGVLESRAAFRGRMGGSVWTDIDQAVGGGPWLVRDGKAHVDAIEQGFRDSTFSSSRHPRTAVGGTLAGELLLVTVDGRQSHSRGMSLPELADYMVKLGAYQAINLDGGGSTSMVVRDLYVNGNSDGAPREVANGLLVFSQAADSAPGETPQIPAMQIIAGESIPISIPFAGQEANGAQPIWGSPDGRGFIDQRGMIHARKSGAFEVGAWIKGASIRIPYTILPAAPTRIAARLVPAPNNPPDRILVEVKLQDRFDNPVSDQKVSFRVVGGVPDQPEVVTDSAGIAQVEIVWDTEKGGQVTVSAAALAPVILKSK
jgi:hypothetical protein